MNANSNRMNAKTNYLAYDIYERHKKVGSLITKKDNVLDVGGELNHLSLFCNPKKIVVANINTGDVIIKGSKLPFKNNSFSTVCAIDVLEHIPSGKRNGFIEELIRVSSKNIILSFPIGTEKHINYEKKIEKWLSEKRQNISYLKEHIKYGLPRKKEIEHILKNKNFVLKYAGKLSINKLLFQVFMFDPKIKYLRKVIFYLKNIFYFLSNPFLYLLLSNVKYSENVVRAYVLIRKNK